MRGPLPQVPLGGPGWGGWGEATRAATNKPPAPGELECLRGSKCTKIILQLGGKASLLSLLVNTLQTQPKGP